MTFKKLNPKYLPYFIAAVQSVMFAYVGVKYFGLWGWLIGPGVGAGVNLSLAISSSKISDIAKKRQPIARLMYVLLFVLSPATIALTIYLPTSVFTAIAWAAAPDLAIALTGAIIGGGMIAKENRESESQAKPERKKRAANRPQKVPCEWCGKPLADSQNAKNAHAAYCEVLQEAGRK